MREDENAKKTYTRILATIGPSSADERTISALLDAGADAFRFNFSHGTREEHKQRYDIVRRLAEEKGLFTTIVADLQGPKLRVGSFATGSVVLKEGGEFVLDMKEEPGNEARVTLPHKEIFAAIKPGDDLLLNDGNIVLTVKSCDAASAVTEVKVGGELSSHKGVNLPNIKLPISAITEKDRSDLEFALEMGVDWVCLSFVQSADDVRAAKALIGDRALIISKLENRARSSNWKILSSFPTVLWLPAATSGSSVRCKRCRFCKRRLSTPAANMRGR